MHDSIIPAPFHVAIRYGMLAVTFLLLAGCATAPTPLYQPDLQNPPSMSLTTAFDILLGRLKQSQIKMRHESERRWASVTDVKLADDGRGVHLALQAQYSTPFYPGFLFGDAWKISMNAGGPPGLSYVVSIPVGDFSWKTLEEAKIFADALVVLYRATPEQILTERNNEIQGQKKLEDEAFAKYAADYRSKKVKQELPEDARKFGVQAEAAIERKKYDDAITLYQKTLGIAPWWAQGHYNLAQVLATQKNYDEAIAEMKKYLLLELNAADAREAQDDIYKWEGLSGGK